MPRQPLPPNLRSGPWGFGPFLINFERSEHSSIIGNCTTVWPFVLHQLALILGILMGGDTRAAVAVFSTFQNARARFDALRAAAQVALDPAHIELFEAILAVTAAAEKERNSFAHGCFGTSAAIRDGVLWISSGHFASWNVAEIRKETTTTPDDYRELAQHIFVYTKNDLQQIYEQIKDTWTLLYEFSHYIRYRPPPGPTADARYRQLCNLPRVATALVQIRSGKKNSL
jgi:hypothetical protein